jgi:hypothetical protein
MVQDADMGFDGLKIGIDGQRGHPHDIFIAVAHLALHHQGAAAHAVTGEGEILGSPQRACAGAAISDAAAAAGQGLELSGHRRIR